MLSVLMSTFLCFSTTVGNINAISESKSNSGIMLSHQMLFPVQILTMGVMNLTGFITTL